jgi:large conductance mechanosensitive channel
LREHAVVGLAVGFIIGLQAQTMMRQLVDSFVTPMLDFLLGKELMNKQFVLHSGTAPVAFTWGKFLYAFINFLIVVLVVYLIVKVLRLDRLDKPKKD